MTEKRFINDVDNGKLYDTKGEMYTIYYDDRVDFYSLWEFLNKLNDENEELKKENKYLRCTIESNSQDDYIDYLEKQNERLKERITELASHDKIVFMNGQGYEIF